MSANSDLECEPGALLPCAIYKQSSIDLEFMAISQKIETLL